VAAADTLRAMADYETRRFSRIEYEKLIELGVFQPGEAIELLGGHLVVAEPQGAAHYTAVVKAARALQGAFGPAWYVRMQGPIGLDDESEPEPDVAVVPGTVDDYGRAHPSRVALVVEVAEASLAVDRQYKGSLYARAGVADYWIVNVVDRVLEVYREPQADSAAAFGWRYTRNDTLGPPAGVTPLAAPAASVPVSEFLP
jgi:Uma2 family endonuclease